MNAGVRSRARIARTGVLALGAASLALGCPAFNQQNRDIDHAPVTAVGTGASILMPGESAPVYQGAQHPRQTGQGSFGRPSSSGSSSRSGASVPGTAPPRAPAASPPGAEQRSVSGAPPAAGGSHITMIGGNTTERELHISVDEKPAWWKYVMLPVAVVAAPFKYAADAALPDPEPGPEVPRLENAPPPPPRAPAPGDNSAANRPLDYESRAIEQLERELDQRGPSPSASTDDPFAAELALLRQQARRPRQPAAPRQAPTQQAMAPPPVETATARRAASRPADPTLQTASGHVDRDGDSRTDHWIFRERGEIVRELFDEDFDGRPDRTLLYDLTSHQVRSIEEDGDHDGSIDTWTSLRDGAIVRRRNDTDGDGHVDTWSFFQNGSLARLERDSDGDGFRDRVTRYESGRLAREDQDEDADGRVETVRYYDADERVSRLEEDTDHDGRIDMITHYREGRLHRRELLDPSALVPVPSLSEHD